MRIVKYIFLLSAVLMVFSCPVFAAEDTIQAVSVHLMTDDKQALPAYAVKRMSRSVAAIGEQLLLGRKAAEIATNSGQYEKLIREVFDRVLVGYSIQSVEILPASQTADISLKLVPWGETVREVRLEVDYGGAAPEIVELIRKDLGNIQGTIDEVLLGLPVESVEWAGSVSKNVVREKIEARLPEFRSSIDIVPGESTLVKLTLSPTSPIVQNVHVALRSHSFPNILLEQVRPDVEAATNVLTGIPAAFIDRHRAFFTCRLSELTAQHALTKRYGLTFTPNINAAEETEVTLKAETSLYNVTLEGYLDMGRHDNDTSFKLHVGKNFGKKAEVFVENVFIPGSITWNVMPGMLYHHDYTAAGFKYDVSNSDFVLLLNQYLGNHWSVRFERTPISGRNEFGIRYKMHEFVSAEYVFTNTDKWLRLIGHL
ncbi:MAG: hypothetical protein LLG02_12120 [Pelosinus sp.]|nr:hypothetical protein [Pelosinus sp.]